MADTPDSGDPTTVTLYPGEDLHVQTPVASPVASPVPPADIAAAYARALELRYSHDFPTMVGYLTAYEEIHGLEHRTVPRPRVSTLTFTFTVVDNRTYVGKETLETRVREEISNALGADGLLAPSHKVDWFIKVVS